jgi:C1A family cysteine protease
MILRRSALLLLPALATAYFSDVNNAHIELLNGAPSNVGSNELEVLLQGKLWGEHTPSSIIAEFEIWVERFERKYESLTEKGERLLVWLENHALIEAHNAKQLSFSLSHNDYSDLSFAEFQQRMNLDVKPTLTKTKFNFIKHAKEEAQNKLRGDASEVSVTQRRLAEDEGKDWSSLGLIGPIRNQGLCGACWAFSAVGSIESAMAIGKFNAMTPDEQSEEPDLVGVDSEGRVTEQLGLVIPLSEQNLIDCDVRLEKGCDGGLMITDFDEEEAKKGICSENDYPYIQSQGTCASSMCTPVPGSKIKDHVDIEPRKTAELVEALKVNPVTAALVASDPTLQFYSSGIYSVPDCGKVTKEKGDEDCQMLYEDQDTCLPDVNHGVLVVGYGTDESITDGINTFFKVKNSWGDAWGEGGYFRIARYDQDPTDPKTNWGECAILSILSYPVME